MPGKQNIERASSILTAVSVITAGSTGRIPVSPSRMISSLTDPNTKAVIRSFLTTASAILTVSAILFILFPKMRTSDESLTRGYSYSEQYVTATSALSSIELSVLLFEDLRIEESAVRKMNQDVVAELEGAYHSTNVSRLYSFLRRI